MLKFKLLTIFLLFSPLMCIPAPSKALSLVKGELFKKNPYKCPHRRDLKGLFQGNVCGCKQKYQGWSVTLDFKNAPKVKVDSTGLPSAWGIWGFPKDTDLKNIFKGMVESKKTENNFKICTYSVKDPSIKEKKQYTLKSVEYKENPDNYWKLTLTKKIKK